MGLISSVHFTMSIYLLYLHITYINHFRFKPLVNEITQFERWGVTWQKWGVSRPRTVQTLLNRGHFLPNRGHINKIVEFWPEIKNLCYNWMLCPMSINEIFFAMKRWIWLCVVNLRFFVNIRNLLHKVKYYTILIVNNASWRNKDCKYIIIIIILHFIAKKISLIDIGHKIWL